MLSGDQVRIRAIDLQHTISPAGWKAHEPYWETDALWYDPSRYDARFVIADAHGIFSRYKMKRSFGKPSATYRVANWYVLVYPANLLRNCAAQRTVTHSSYAITRCAGSGRFARSLELPPHAHAPPRWLPRPGQARR